MNWRNVAVLMGGFSAEREVSLRSGGAVVDALKQAGYQVYSCDIREEEWSLPPEVEAVFIALHGTYGEDGQVQAELERRGIPYTGSGPAASRRAFDKIVTKKILSNGGVPTPRFSILNGFGDCPMELPLVIKPPRQGSSVGVERVGSVTEWTGAVNAALEYDSELLVEEFIAGRELTVGVLDGEALPVVEIVAPDSWYNYSSKYTGGVCRYLVPAPLDKQIEDDCRKFALRTFEVLGCRTFGRVDFRLSNDGLLFALEMNTIPGFTETSLMPKSAAAAGIGFVELCDRIMRQASLNNESDEQI